MECRRQQLYDNYLWSLWKEIGSKVEGNPEARGNLFVRLLIHSLIIYNYDHVLQIFTTYENHSTPYQPLPHIYHIPKNHSELGFKTGNTGTGMVLIFSTPWHTAYQCRGIIGTHGFMVVRLSLFFFWFELLFKLFKSLFFPMSHCDRTNYSCVSLTHLHFHHHHHISTGKQTNY